MATKTLAVSERSANVLQVRGGRGTERRLGTHGAANKKNVVPK